MIPVNSIVVPERFVSACSGWYSGIDDLLYAVCSTGNLTTGTIRPLGCDSDEKWYLTLWRELSADVGRAARAARDRVIDFEELDDPSEYDEYEVYSDDAGNLEDFEDWIDNEVIPSLEDSYNLSGWERE